MEPMLLETRTVMLSLNVSFGCLPGEFSDPLCYVLTLSDFITL